MFLQRILDSPHLAKAVARLQPELLHRVIQKVGLEDAAELVALATPEQLSRVFDLDLWQAARPGVEEQFDAARFGIATDAAPQQTELTSAKRPWLVKYDGPCSSCGKVLVKGTPAVWRQAERRMLCMECAAA